MAGKTDWGKPSTWYGLITVLLALYLAWGDDGFSLLAFLIAWGFFWIIGIPFRALGWVSERLTSRPCPVCGMPVKNGKTNCDSCGTDFRLR